MGLTAYSLVEVVVWILLTLKIHGLWPGFNLQTMGLMASMITTRPPRMTVYVVIFTCVCFVVVSTYFRQLQVAIVFLILCITFMFFLTVMVFHNIPDIYW
jgi:hypothetical protein